MDMYDEDDAVFSQTNAAPLNAADAARRLLSEGDHGDSMEYAQAALPQPPKSSKNKIAEKLAQMRGGNSANSGGYALMASQGTAEINVGYKAPAMGYSDMPLTHSNTQAGRMDFSQSTSFAPVSLPPTHMGESTFSMVDNDGPSDPSGSSTPFLMDRDQEAGINSHYSMREYLGTCAQDIAEIAKTYCIMAWEKYRDAPTWAQIVVGLILLAFFVKFIDSI